MLGSGLGAGLGLGSDDFGYLLPFTNLIECSLYRHDNLFTTAQLRICQCILGCIQMYQSAVPEKNLNSKLTDEI